MTLAITPIYASILALLFLTLTFRVIGHRRKHKVGLGDGGHSDLERRIRAHGNASETMPIGVILLVIAELMGAPAIALHLAGFMFVAGRILHAYGLSAAEQNFACRRYGMILTLLVLLVLPVGILLHALF